MRMRAMARALTKLKLVRTILILVLVTLVSDDESLTAARTLAIMLATALAALQTNACALLASAFHRSSSSCVHFFLGGMIPARSNETSVFISLVSLSHALLDNASKYALPAGM